MGANVLFAFDMYVTCSVRVHGRNMFGSCALIVWRHKMQPLAKSHADFDLGFRLVDFSCRAGVHGYPLV